MIWFLVVSGLMPADPVAAGVGIAGGIAVGLIGHWLYQRQWRQG